MKRIRSPIGRIFMCFVLIYAAVINTACGAEMFDDVFKKSAQFAKVTETASTSIGDLHRAGIIPQGFALKLQKGLLEVNTRQATFHRMVVIVRDKYAGDYKKVTNLELNDLDKFFSVEVVKLFLDTLSEIGVLDTAIAAKVLAVFAPVKILVMGIAQLFGNLQSVAGYVKEFGEPESYKAFLKLKQRMEVLEAYAE